MIHGSVRLPFGFFFQIFLVFRHRPVIEELADIILSADIKTVEAIQDRYGEQVEIISFNILRFSFGRFLDFLLFASTIVGCLSGKAGSHSTEIEYGYGC